MPSTLAGSEPLFVTEPLSEDELEALLLRHGAVMAINDGYLFFRPPSPLTDLAQIRKMAAWVQARHRRLEEACFGARPVQAATTRIKAKCTK